MSNLDLLQSCSPLTPRDLEIGLSVLEPGKSYSADEISVLAYPARSRSAVNDTLELLRMLGFLKSVNGRYMVSEDIKMLHEECASELSKRTLSLLVQDGVISEVLPQDAFGYDLARKSIYVRASYIPIRFHRVRNLLLRLTALQEEADGLLYVNSSLQHMFENVLIPAVRQDLEESGLSLEDFMKIKARQRALGEHAERLAMAYERARLRGSGLEKEIKQISLIDVGAGYDVASFLTKKSTEHDLFIEVKYTGRSGSFHWSRNEVETASAKRDGYAIYLFDGESDEPSEIISNPYATVYENAGWSKEPDSWRVSRNPHA